MSKTRYKWWGYVKNMIREYPALKKEYEDLHQQSITANMSGTPCGGSQMACSYMGYMIPVAALHRPRMNRS